MKKSLFVIIGVILVLSLNLVLAQEYNFAETKQLIDSGISCNQLSSEQLEAIGDYYMEQMHPGQAHEIMDQMMGGEGSESLKQVHINIAKRLYCNDNIYIGYGIMSGGMMSGGQIRQTNFMSGMMGNWNYFGSWGILMILYLILLIGIIVLVYFWIRKMWKDSSSKKVKKDK